MSAYTCISCRVGFPDGDSQRMHYKTDWHRYNLKRKVAGLQPVSAENFRDRVTAQRKAAQEASEEASASFDCAVCRKSFSSKPALDNHLQSKKHKDKEKKKAQSSKQPCEPSITPTEFEQQPVAEQTRKQKAIEQRFLSGQAESGGTEDESVLELVDCIFCTRRLASFEANVEHMMNDHGFFIPDIKYLVDLTGLVHYLQRKVGNYFMCLTCGDRGKAFGSLEATRKHMVDKGHIQVNYEEDDGQIELGDFYDFSSTYPDNDMISEDEKDLTLALRPNTQGTAYFDDGELTLPSGKRVGHRDLRYIYKQRIKTDRESDAIRIQRIMSQYKALGYHGKNLPSAVKQRDQRREQQFRKSRQLEFGMKHNKLQFHYREQVMQ